MHPSQKKKKSQTHELSESRYLWTSKIKLVMLPSVFVTLPSAAAEPFETKVSADVQLFPGSRMSWVVAPAWRMAVTAAWTDCAQRLMSGMSWGSFMLGVMSAGEGRTQGGLTRRR